MGAVRVDPLAIRAAMGRKVWGVPQPFGQGWRLLADGPEAAYNPSRVVAAGTIIVTLADDDGDRVEYIHASMSWCDRMPTYEDLTRLHRCVFGDAWAYEVFAPASDHVNIHPHARHLWGRADGRAVLPNFGRYGTI